MSALYLLERLVHASRHPALLDPLFAALMLPNDQHQVRRAALPDIKALLRMLTAGTRCLYLSLTTDVISCRLLGCPVFRSSCFQHCRARMGPWQQLLCSFWWLC